MHELSAAASILDIALKTGEQYDAVRINSIELLIGELSCIQAEALVNCFEIVSDGTIAENAELIIRVEKSERICTSCGRVVFVQEKACPVCQCDMLRFSKGFAFLITGVDIEERDMR